METKEIKIVPPEGYEIDKENSTFDCIRFKHTIKQWRDNTEARVNGYIITCNAIITNIEGVPNTPKSYDVFATEKQAKSTLAMARISQIMANDKRFGGVVTDEEWNNSEITKYVLVRRKGEIDIDYYYTAYQFLAFHTSGQRELFLEENEDLVKDYLMIE